jgi:putative transposase
MPRKIVTKQLRSYPAAKTEIAEPANVEHVFIETVRVNNRAENSYLAEHTRASHPSGISFKTCVTFDLERMQRFLSSFAPLAALCAQATFTTRFALPRTTQ